MRLKNLCVVRQVTFLFFGISAYRIMEAFVGEPMRRQRRLRSEASTQLVFSLCPGFKTLQAVINTIFNRRVVASLEVQVGSMIKSTPVTAIQRIFASEKKGTGNGAAPLLCDQQLHSVGKGLHECFEKLSV